MTDSRYDMTLLDFLDSDLDRAWVTEEGLNIYARKAHHVLHFPDAGQEPRACLDLATLEAHDPGNGALRLLLPHFRSLAATHDLWLRIENVMAPRFQEFWSKRGFIVSYEPGDDQKRLPSFWSPPQWSMEMGPYRVTAFRSDKDDRIVMELDGPEGGRPQDSLPNTEPTLRIWVNDHLAVKCSDEE